MFAEDLAVIREQFEAVNRRDFERALELYADDVVLVVPPIIPGEGNVMETGVFEGKEAVGRWFGSWIQAFGPDYHFDLADPEDLGGGLIYLFARHGGHGRASGVEVRGENAYLHRVRDGKVSRVGFFPGREAALKAAATPEWSEAETH